MRYYIGYLIFIAIQGLFIYQADIFKGCNKKKIFCALSGFELTAFVSLRAYTVGADTEVYVSAFEHYSQIPILDIFTHEIFCPYFFEIGYTYLNVIIGFLFRDYSVFLFIIASLIYYFTYRFFYIYSPFIYLSITIYFGLGIFHYSLGIFRQLIALSIILFGVQYIIDRKLKKWIATVIFAMMFHVTALISLPIFYITRITYKKFFYLAILVQPLLTVVSRPILEYLTSFFPSYFSYVGSWRDSVNGSMSMFFVFNIILVLCYFYNEYLIVNNSKYIRFFLNCVPVLCCFQTMAYSFGMLGRAIPYFTIYLTVLIPIIINDIFSKKQALLISSIVSILFIALFIYTTIDDEYILPVLFFWELS